MRPNKEVAQKQRQIFADNLRYYLKQRGKTQADLVQDLEVTSSTVSDWANARKYPRVDKMQLIADYLGVLMSDLREEKLAQEDELSSVKNDLMDIIRSVDDDTAQALLIVARTIANQLDK